MNYAELLGALISLRKHMESCAEEKDIDKGDRYQRLINAGCAIGLKHSARLLGNIINDATAELPTELRDLVSHA